MTRLDKKQVFKLLRAGILAAASYDLKYRINNRLKQSYNDSVSLQEMEIELYPRLNWIGEEDYESEMNEVAVPFIQEYEHKGSVFSNGANLKYLMYLKDKTFPTVFIVHGFNEFKEKYRELIYYFLQLDKNVVVYDARGHGESRLNFEQQLIDLENFNDYVEDLKLIVDKVGSSYRLTGDFNVFGHSMGGAVTTAFLSKYPAVFNAAILSSPMLSIETSPYPKSLTYALATTARWVNAEDKPIPSQGSNQVVKATEIYAINEELTYNENRGRYYFNLNRELNDSVTSGGTMNWLSASMQQLNQLMRAKHLKNIQIPILIYQSLEDKVVKADGIYTAATYLPNVELVSVKEVGHEIYLEGDTILKPYFSLIGYFLNQNSHI